MLSATFVPFALSTLIMSKGSGEDMCPYLNFQGIHLPLRILEVLVRQFILVAHCEGGSERVVQLYNYNLGNLE